MIVYFDEKFNGVLENCKTKDSYPECNSVIDNILKALKELKKDKNEKIQVENEDKSPSMDKKKLALER